MVQAAAKLRKTPPELPNWKETDVELVFYIHIFFYIVLIIKMSSGLLNTDHEHLSHLHYKGCNHKLPPESSL